MLILVPPSEGKAEGGRTGSAWDPASGVSGRVLGPMRREVAGALRGVKGGTEELLGVKGAALDRARTANMALVGAATLPAWRRYTGVVWDHLDLASMSAPDRSAAAKRLYIPSGLMGLVRADEPVPDYKLKMGAALPGTGRLSAWWRGALTDELIRAARRESTVVDLLPQEHAAAVDWERLGAHVRVVHLDLVSTTRGGKVGGHDAKAAKGLLTRHILEARQSAPLADTVSGFSHPRYVARIR
ncbi:MAG: hypothetical protein RLZZ305_611 [Actinomycetota bacterium]